MNRIYQGEVTDVEIHESRILSASTGERTEVKCRNQYPWQPFDLDPTQANWVAQATRLSRSAARRTPSVIGYRSSLIGHSPKAHAHQLFQTR